MSLLLRHKPSTKPDGPSNIDAASSTGFGVTGYWTFSGKSAKFERNAARSVNGLTISSGMTRSNSHGSRTIKSKGATNSSATTSAVPSVFGINQSGTQVFTVFARFRADSNSTVDNQGGIFTMGALGTGNNLLTIRQINDPAPDNGPNQWAVQYATSGTTSGRLRFLVPNTANNIHTIVVTYDGANLTVFSDGSFNTTQVVALSVSNFGTVDIGRANVPPVEPIGSYMWADFGMPVLQWPLYQSGQGMWFDMGAPITQWPTNDSGSNYFSGHIFEAGIANIAWNQRQAREWNATPYRLLRDKRASLFGPPANSTLSCTIVALAAKGGIGPMSFISSPANISFGSVIPVGGIGNIQIGTFLQLQILGMASVPQSGGVGAPDITRQGGLWTPVVAAPGTWSPVTPAVGG